MSRYDFSPSEWGGPAWKFLYYVTLSYPENPTPSEKDNYKKFYLSLQSILPCEKCRVNFEEHISKFPITNYLDNQETILDWLILINNEVNKKINMPSVTKENIKKKYFNKSSSSGYNVKKILIIIGILICVGIVSYKVIINKKIFKNLLK